jgi:hypothetical protein
LGCAIVLSEWNGDVLIGGKFIMVDGILIKEKTFYKLINGEVVIAE